MYNPDLYGLQSELAYRAERAATPRRPRARRRRKADPYTPWLRLHRDQRAL